MREAIFMSDSYLFLLLLTLWLLLGIKSSIYDIKHYKVKINDIIGFFVITLCYVFFFYDFNWLIAIAFPLVAYMLYLRKYLGSGDVFLVGCIGFWIANFFEISIFFILAGIFGIIMSFAMGVRVIPFVPALVHATWLTKFVSWALR